MPVALVFNVVMLVRQQVHAGVHTVLVRGPGHPGVHGRKTLYQQQQRQPNGQQPKQVGWG